MTSNELSLERLFLILRTRIKLILSVVVTTLFLAGLVTYLTPEMYVARTSLNFDFKSANPVDRQGRVLEAKDYLYTQIDVMESLNVAQKVVDSLTDYELDRLIAAMQAEQTVIDKMIRGIKDALKFVSASEEQVLNDVSDTDASKSIRVNSAYSWVAQLIRRNLSVEPRVNSRIVTISYSSTNPRLAALLANRFAEAYIATNLEMTIDPARKTSLWFDEQLKALRTKLEEAQAALTAYQQKEGIVSSDERLDTESARLRELSSQLIKAQQETRNAVFAKKKLDEIQKKGVPLTSFSLVFDNPVVKSIKAEIRKRQGELVDISATLGRNHPRYKKASAELAAARKRLEAEIKVITDGINNNAELAKAREMDLSQALDLQKQLVLDLKQQRNKITVLEREVESANKTYNAALAQLNTTNMQSLVDQTNVFIVDSANIPRQPSSPKLIKNLALGLLVGLMLGIGLVVLLEVFARRVHSKEDLLLELKVPLLAHLKKA